MPATRPVRVRAANVNKNIDSKIIEFVVKFAVYEKTEELCILTRILSIAYSFNLHMSLSQQLIICY